MTSPAFRDGLFSFLNTYLFKKFSGVSITFPQGSLSYPIGAYSNERVAIATRTIGDMDDVVHTLCVRHTTITSSICLLLIISVVVFKSILDLEL